MDSGKRLAIFSDRYGQISELLGRCVAEPEVEELESGYIIVRSASPVLASAANKLSAWVSMKMESGWTPHGPPQIHNDGDKFYIIQAMTK